MLIIAAIAMRMNIVFVLATGMEDFVNCMKGNDYDYNNIQERSKICDRKKIV